MMLSLRTAVAVAARGARATAAPVGARALASTVGHMDVKEVIRSRKTNMSKTYDGFQTFKDPVVIERAEGQYCYGPNGEKCVRRSAVGSRQAACCRDAGFADSKVACLPAPTTARRAN
jgi:hypothetical protein